MSAEDHEAFVIEGANEGKNGAPPRPVVSAVKSDGRRVVEDAEHREVRHGRSVDREGSET